jgi:hypothetical protein
MTQQICPTRDAYATRPHLARFGTLHTTTLRLPPIGQKSKQRAISECTPSNMVVALPVELYRSVAQGVDRKGLFRLVKVSRAFQFESERLIYQRITFLFSKQVIQGCRHLLKTPRFWGYIQRLELLHASQEDMHSQWTAGFQQLIGRFLAKLTNLVELSIIAFPGDLKWRSCGTLFRNCRFQLLMLRCSFVLDNHFDSFLKTQRSLITLEWSPGFVSSYRLSPKAAPNLAAIAFHGSQFNAAPWEAFAHCPITHVLWGSPKPERTPLAFVSMASLKAVKIFGPSLEILTALVASSPGLEYLGIIDYTAVEVKNRLLILRILHLIDHTHRNPLS